jgi:hypothetical protein
MNVTTKNKDVHDGFPSLFNHSSVGVSHQTWSDFSAPSVGPTQKSHAMESLIEAVLADNSASATLKRIAALAKVDELSSGLPHHKPGHSLEGTSPRQQLPLSVMPNSNSHGGGHVQNNYGNLMIPQ